MDIYLEFLIPFACIPILKMSRHSNIKTQFVHRNLMSSLSPFPIITITPKSAMYFFPKSLFVLFAAIPTNVNFDIIMEL